MAKSVYYFECIPQCRSVFPSTECAYILVDAMEKYLNEIYLDYLNGNQKKWISWLLQPTPLGIRVSLQNAMNFVHLLIEERKALLELARLFVRELESYDQVHGYTTSVDWLKTISSAASIDDFMLGLSLAFAQDCDGTFESLSVPTAEKAARWTLDRSIALFALLLDLYGHICSKQPNPQLNELIDLQKQEIAIIQEANSNDHRSLEQLGEWLIDFQEEYEQRTSVLNEELDAIKEKTAAIEQLVQEINEQNDSQKPSETESNDSNQTCDCTCHNNGN